MKFNEDLATIHGYLCGDGYVIRNLETQKHKYYHIGFRNTNTVLLKDFQTRFKNSFGLKPIITKDGRCRIQNKEIFFLLTREFSYYSNEWKVPELSKNLLKCWLRAYFDCDAWVAVQKAKSRAVMIESINEKGLNQIADVLRDVFEINTSSVKKRKNRNIWYTYICGKDNIEKFKNEIGFLHPFKKNKLNEAVYSYETYIWEIPREKEKLLNFINRRGKIKSNVNEIGFCSIFKVNLMKLKSLLRLYNIKSKIYGPWKNSYGTKYFHLTLKQNELKKLR